MLETKENDMVQQMKQKPLCFAIEGNIGAGKSTFLRKVGHHLDVQMVFEPDRRWQDVGGENLLEQFYKDTKRWAYSFQTYVFMTRVFAQEEHCRADGIRPQILERSVFTDRHCFAKNCYEMGGMSSLEWKMYQEWFSWFIDNYVQAPDAFIYLRTSPEKCYERMLKRSRSAEAGVPLSYLKLLHDKHEDWLVHRTNVVPRVEKAPVLILDCNPEFEHDQQQFLGHIQMIIEFLQQNFAVSESEIRKKERNICQQNTLVV